MSAPGQNNNNDTQRIDNDTVSQNDNHDTQRIDTGTGTVRLNDNHDTQRIDNDTVRLGGGAPSGGAPGGAVLSGMGNAAGIIPQQNAQIYAGTSFNTGEFFRDGDVIEINGRNYTIEHCISKDSGEAFIYKVNKNGNPCVLKHYKIKEGNPIKPPMDVLEQIKDNPRDMIIKLFDFGKHNIQYFEIIEYAEGGTLNDYLKEKGPIKDIAILKRIVGQIAEGLKQLHDLRIIYQDLKPENIYFRDAKKTEIILADFGISSVMKPGEKKTEVVVNATPIYAAPELAVGLGQGSTADAGPPIDYFSLGITMLELWLGKRPFEGMEYRKRADQIRNNKIEFPPDMPDDYKTLIRGLIDSSDDTRWGNKQIKDWLEGKALQNNSKRTDNRYELRKFNETETYDTPEKLAELMDRDHKLGISYLFSDRITSWLKEAGDDHRLQMIEDIISNYGANKEAGLYLSIYALDFTKPLLFISHGGKTCSETNEIADAIMAESAYYMEELKKPEAKLYLYFEAREGSEGRIIAEQLRKNFEEYSPKRALNLVYLKLQSTDGQSIKIGGKTYQNPEEAAAETDSKQIALIKESVQEEDSLFLVWLSEHYGELFTTTGGFWKLNTSDRFYLLSRFPFLSYKEFMGNNWEQAAISDLIILIHTSPGRLDLFETYAAQGLPFNGKAPDTFVNWRPTAMCYLAMFFKDKNIINDERAGFELVRFLSKHGADINEGSGQGELPLSIAVLKRNVPLVKLFLELGADPNRVDSNGCAPLMLALYKWTDNGEEEEDAVVNDRIAIANMLLDYNVNVRLSDEDSRTPLLLAIYLESAEKNSLVSRLLDAGLDINERNDDGHTPLSIAVITYGNAKNKQSALEVIELLLKKGAKTETLSTKGYFSPLMVAADVNAVDAAQMLLKYGARKNFSDEDGETAFVYAAKRNYTQMMELVDPGADYKSKNSLFSFLKAAVSILAIGAVFLTIDVLARAILTFHLSYPVLWGVSLFLSHLLTAYILIALLGLREYLIRLRGAFNFIGSGLRYIVGVPIVFPLLILPLQFLTRFLPAQITSALSYPAELLTRPTTGFAMLAGYIVLLGAIMTGTVYFNRVNEKFSKQMELYRYYSGSLKTSSGNNKSILKYVLAAAVIGLIVFLFFMLKNSPKEAAPVSINTPNVQEFVENGQKYYDKGDYDNAIKQFDEVIKNDPKNALGYAWRGNTYRRKNQLDTAIKDFNEAVSLDPAYSFAYSRRGEAYRAKGDLRTAVKDFNEALKLDPNDSWAYGSRGQAHKQLGQTEQAIQDFRKALSLDPGIEWVKKELQAMEAPKPAKEPEAAETMEAAETTEAAEN